VLNLIHFKIPKKFLGVLVLLIIALLTMKFTGIERTTLTPVEKALRELLAPLQSGVTTVARSLSNVTDSILSYKEIQEENKLLKEKVRKLTIENSHLEEFRQENVRLNLLLDFKRQYEERWEMEPAHVIARDYDNWNSTIIIDKGSNHGIKKDMAVSNYQGLVGRVINVTPNTAEVLLIIDSESAVGALAQTTRVPGVVEAATDGNEKLQMVHIPHDAPLPVNGVIITSGLGQIFPKGLKIGYIKKVIPAPNGLVKKALVKPFVDFDSLEEVLVIKKDKGATP
jgi:rod shape-determining protein MreC